MRYARKDLMMVLPIQMALVTCDPFVFNAGKPLPDHDDCRVIGNATPDPKPVVPCCWGW